MNKVVQMLSALADQRGLLQMYREDLTKHDAEVLKDLEGWSRFVWIAGETFSYLIPWGLHRKGHEMALAVLNSRSGVRYCGVLAGDVIHEVDEQTIRGMASRPVLKFVNGDLFDESGERHIGWISLSGKYDYASSKTKVTLQTQPGRNRKVPNGWLERWALYEAEARYGLWFYMLNAQASTDKFAA